MQETTCGTNRDAFSGWFEAVSRHSGVCDGLQALRINCVLWRDICCGGGVITCCVLACDLASFV